MLNAEVKHILILCNWFKCIYF